MIKLKLLDNLASHPYDLKYDDLVRVKMLFPENKALFGDDEKRGHFVTNGVDLHVKLYLLITLQIFEK